MMREFALPPHGLPYAEVEARSPDAPGLIVGRVSSLSVSGELSLDCEDLRVAARRAFSCLVEPVAGDRVLASRTPEGVYVLAVLERLVPDHARIVLPSGGALTIEADDLRLKAGREVAVEGATVAIRGGTFTVLSDAFTAVGRLATWVADTIRMSSRTQEVSADTLSSRSLDRVTIVERADVLRAGTLTQTVDDVATTTAPIAVIATQEDLRLDGKRVTVG